MKKQISETTVKLDSTLVQQPNSVIEETTENQNFFGEFLSHIKIFELAGHGLQHDIYLSENANIKIAKYFE